MIIGVFVFLLLVLLPKAVSRILSTNNLLKIQGYTYLLGVIIPLSPFVYLGTLSHEIDQIPYYNLIFFPLGWRRAPNDHAILTLFTVPISGTVIEGIVFAWLLFSYIISSTLGLTSAFIIQTKKEPLKLIQAHIDNDKLKDLLSKAAGIAAVMIAIETLSLNYALIDLVFRFMGYSLFAIFLFVLAEVIDSMWKPPETETSSVTNRT